MTAARRKSDNITSKTTELTVTGTAEAGAKVELFTGATSLGTATAPPPARLPRFYITLAAGTHSLAARPLHRRQRQRAVDPMSVTVDTTGPDGAHQRRLPDAPDDLGLSQFDRITSRSICVPPSTATVRRAAPSSRRRHHQPRAPAPTPSSSGAFTKDVILEEGTHTITAKTSDTAGNSSAASNEVRSCSSTSPRRRADRARPRRGGDDNGDGRAPHPHQPAPPAHHQRHRRGRRAGAVARRHGRLSAAPSPVRAGCSSSTST